MGLVRLIEEKLSNYFIEKSKRLNHVTFDPTRDEKDLENNPCFTNNSSPIRLTIPKKCGRKNSSKYFDRKKDSSLFYRIQFVARICLVLSETKEMKN